MERRSHAILWGIATVGMAFWLNELCRQAFSERLCLLLIAPVAEEAAKYLAMRQVRTYSLFIPAIFVIGETLVQQANPFAAALFGEKVLFSVILYALISVCALRHFLFWISL